MRQFTVQDWLTTPSLARQQMYICRSCSAQRRRASGLVCCPGAQSHVCSEAKSSRALARLKQNLASSGDVFAERTKSPTASSLLISDIVRCEIGELPHWSRVRASWHCLHALGCLARAGRPPAAFSRRGHCRLFTESGCRCACQPADGCAGRLLD